mmetsp:Transcript_21921/g.32379  ORF Transcript_21921/g.32379 Transcript_21921/m.32379 type:complete len:129 (+) Transcript_21921:170-556(+)
MTSANSIAPTIQLPEQSDSSSDESSIKMYKRDRSEIPIRFNDQSKDCIKTDSDNYVRAGAKLKNVTSLAISLLWDHIDAIETQKKEKFECIDESANQQKIENNNNVLQLARKKTSECITLEKVSSISA